MAVKRLVDSLRRAVADLESAGATGIEQTDTGRLASLRLWPPGDRRRVVMIDLLFASSGIEAALTAAIAELTDG